jgi:cell division protein FtsN
VQPDPVASFFSNLFGGTPTAQQPAKSSPHMTGSVSQVSAWSSATQTTPVTAATSQDGRGKPRKAAAPKGRYILQVGAARNKAEAEALVRKLSARHPDILRGRQATVTPEVFGNMGTLYQVRVAPFAKAASAQPFCKGLRASGLDCLIQRR